MVDMKKAVFLFACNAVIATIILGKTNGTLPWSYIAKLLKRITEYNELCYCRIFTSTSELAGNLCFQERHLHHFISVGKLNNNILFTCALSMKR